MLKQLRAYTARIIIGISFYLFGFFVAARALALTPHDMVVGLIAGAIAGITMLVVTLGTAEAPAAA